MAGRVVRPLVRAVLAGVLLCSLTAPAVATGAEAKTGAATAGPAIDADAPDPTIVRSRLDGAYYAYTTNAAVPTGVANVPTWRSWDLETWEYVGDALPEVGAWVTQGGEHWAPSVALVGGRYVLYYTAHGPDGRLCIGAATAARLGEPFVAEDSALACPSSGSSGLIDPSVHVEGDEVVLVYKNLGAEQIVGRRLTADGLRPAGPVTTLLNPDALWQAGVVENPSLVRVNGAWLLTYSARDWRTADYATGWAVCTTMLGPCRSGGILLDSTSGLAGPGGLSVIDDGSSRPLVVFHAWTRSVGYEYGGYRALYLGRLELSAYGPVVTLTGVRVRPASPATGSIDATSDVGDGTVRVEGWAMDHSTDDPATVHVYVDGELAASAVADRERADVDAAFGNGSQHGFVVDVPPGKVCVYVLTARGDNPLVGCRTVGTAPPMGAVDLVRTEAGGLRVEGWAADPNTPTRQTDVHIYVDGTGFATTTSAERDDVAIVHESVGAYAGFDVLLPVTDAAQVCAYGINTGPGDNALLGCAALN